jgi:CRP/FNR family cyclic AMP-dependent transcriptional regulator
MAIRTRAHSARQAARRSEPASGARQPQINLLDRACARVLHWLNPEQLSTIRAAASVERFRARSVIAPDEHHLRFLVIGAVRTSYTDEGCRRRLSNFLGPGDMVQNPFFCSPGTLRVFEAISDSTVLNIPVECFAQAVVGVSWTTFKESVTATLGTTFSLLALNTRLRGVRAISRLAQVLLDMASKFGVQDSSGTMLTIRVTRTDLSALVGCSRQQLTMLLNELGKRGVLSNRAGRMVLDIPRLTTLSRLGRAGRANGVDTPLARCFQLMENVPPCAPAEIQTAASAGSAEQPARQH